jgi:hypothetical protein
VRPSAVPSEIQARRRSQSPGAGEEQAVARQGDRVRLLSPVGSSVWSEIRNVSHVPSETRDAAPRIPSKGGTVRSPARCRRRVPTAPGLASATVGALSRCRRPPATPVHTVVSGKVELPGDGDKGTGLGRAVARIDSPRADRAAVGEQSPRRGCRSRRRRPPRRPWPARERFELPHRRSSDRIAQQVRAPYRRCARAWPCTPSLWKEADAVELGKDRPVDALAPPGAISVVNRRPCTRLRGERRRAEGKGRHQREGGRFWGDASRSRGWESIGVLLPASNARAARPA